MLVWKAKRLLKRHFDIVPDEFPDVEHFIKLPSSRQTHAQCMRNYRSFSRDGRVPKQSNGGHVGVPN